MIDYVKKNWNGLKARLHSGRTTRKYVPAPAINRVVVPDLPSWRIETGKVMLYDAAISLPLMARDAALRAGEVEITCRDANVKAFVDAQWKKIWGEHCHELNDAKLWGFKGFEVEFAERDDVLVVAGLRGFAAEDTTALVYAGEVCGFRVRNGAWGMGRSVTMSPSLIRGTTGANSLGGKTPQNAWDLLAPEGLWVTFDARDGRFYGQSILERAYQFWWERWMRYGVRDITRLRMIKDSYIGDIIYYPTDTTVQSPDGTERTWQDVAREFSENRLSGATLTLPMIMDASGTKKLLEYTPPQDMGRPDGIYEWGRLNKEEIGEAIGVPGEVLKAAETGSGFSGRSVPLMVMLAAATDELAEIVACVNRCVLEPLVALNFGRVPFSITAKNLADSFADDIANSSMGGGTMGGGAGERTRPQMQRPQGPQGTQQPQQQFSLEDALAEVGTPTEAQAEAGNYKKGHFSWRGLAIAIENKKGSKRKPEWKPLSAHYGYIKRTEGKDGDHLDVFIGPDLDSDVVFVVNQITEAGRFDEHKCLIGYSSLKEAKGAYLANYPAGWKCGEIVTMTVDQFRQWATTSNLSKPATAQFSLDSTDRPADILIGQTAIDIVTRAARVKAEIVKKKLPSE